MTVGTGSYRTLAFGPGTPYPVVALEGARDLPGIRARELDYAERHGSGTLPDYAGPAQMVLTLGIRGDDHASLEALSEAVRQATPPAAVASELFYRDSTRFRWAKPRRRALPEDSEALWRLGQAVVQFDCPDPREYAATLLSAVANLPSAAASGGVSWPLLWPIGFTSTGTAVGQVVMSNPGNVASTLRLVIAAGVAPLVNPLVYQQETGRTLQLIGTVGTGDSLTIDTEARSVLLNGTASRASLVAEGSAWPLLEPGTNTLLLRGTGDTSATLTATARPAWL